jgi:hypothetical protein
MTANTVSLQSSFRRTAPRLAEPLGRLSAWMRPRPESPAEAAARLRTLANLYDARQPSFAADLRAAADRHISDSER